MAASIRDHARLSAPILLLLILVLDTALAHHLWPFLVTGLLDEPAHLATAGLVLLALPRRVATRYGWWVLIGSVVIDIDHAPLYLGASDFVVDGSRPPTHSLVVVILLLLAQLLPRVKRQLRGLAFGVLAHFLRDVATGPGLALLWPVLPVAVKAPYTGYAVVLVLLTLGAIVRDRVETVALSPAGRAAGGPLE